MNNILIVSSGTQSKEYFTQMLSGFSPQKTDAVLSANEARSAVSDGNYDLILINAPLRDELGDGLARELSQSTDSGIMLFVKSELEAGIERELMPYGVLVLAKPVSRLLFHKSVMLLSAAVSRLRGIKNENDRLHQEVKDIRLINRAKGILMDYLSMTEAQAHKYLEKQAMDLRISKAEVAKRLLSTYEY